VYLVGHPDEQAVLHDPRRRGERRGEAPGVVDGPERTVKDEVPVVSDHWAVLSFGGPEDWLAPGRLDCGLDGPAGIRKQFDRNGVIQRRGAFCRVSHDDEPVSVGVDEFFAGVGGTAALDEVAVVVHLVGTVDGDIHAVVVERRQRDAGLSREAPGLVGGGNAADVEAGVDAVAQFADGVGGGTAGAEADHVAVLGELRRGLACTPFRVVAAAGLLHDRSLGWGVEMYTGVPPRPLPRWVDAPSRLSTRMARTAVIAGVGPGLGASVARTFHEEGCNVALLARSTDYTAALAEELGEGAIAVACDIADEAAVVSAFVTVRDAFGPVDVLVNNASAASWDGLMACPTDSFDRALDVGARGAYLCSQEAVGDMLEADGGTVIFTGATTSVRGREGAVGFSAAKFAARGLAESMARELGPEGIHVAHTVIDGGILPPEADVENPEDYLDPDAIAESYWHLVEQDRSAWTLELDLRPHVEEF
jgi:NAD(P)-dependent dehydrogenase (short-subunit alcohol dehydrogenase family)